MADSDPVEFRLYDTDFITIIAILPVAAGSRLYLELNEPGSGMVVIPNDCAAAALVAENQFIVAFYRGAYRGGFLVDNIETVGASSGEGGDKWMQISGRGPLALLNEAIIWPEDAAKTTREFDDYKWSTMFIFLFAEASMRGAVANVTLDWTDAVDSDGTAWTDTGYYSYTNGESLLDVLRDIAKLGYEFTMTFGDVTPGWFTLHAYKNPTGTDKSETIYMRVGTNCEEVGVSEKSDELANAYLIKYAKSYTSTEDPVSIAANRRREKLYHSDEASSPTLARQWGNAMLDNTTDPKKEIRVKVYDGVRPYAFVEYSVGDTVVLDNKGTETDYRLRGMELEWGNDQYASIMLSLNSSFVEYELRVAQELERLKRLYTKAHDSNLLETSFWAAIGELSAIDQIAALAQIGNEIFVGGIFTKIGNVACNNLASYDISTGEWTAIGSFTAAERINALTVIGTDLYIGFLGILGATNTAILKWDSITKSMSALGTGMQDTSQAEVSVLAASGTDLYASGSFLSAGGVADTKAIAKWNGTAWSSIGAVGATGYAWPMAMVVIGTDLYVGGTFTQFCGITANYIIKYNGSTWSAFATEPNNGVFALATDGTNLFVGGSFTAIGALTAANYIAKWDPILGAWSALGNGTDDFVYALFANEISLYVGGVFTTINGVAISCVALWDGYNWYDLAGGVNSIVYALHWSNDALYVGGNYSSAGEGAGAKVADSIAAYITSFNPLVEHLDKGGKKARWGQISGTLSDQLDLQAELDTKVDSVGTANGLSIAGTAISLAAATAANPGAMSAAYATKLDGIEAGAGVNKGLVVFDVDGALAVATNLRRFVFPVAASNSLWYFYLWDTGTAGSTIADIHLFNDTYPAGITIFTTQANRPTVAYNDANGWTVATSDITDFVAGDVLIFGFDQVATGAADAMCVGGAVGGGGGGLSFGETITTEGKAQNRNTAGAYSYQEQPTTLYRPIKLISIQWDIRVAGDYTLSIRDENGTVIEDIIVVGIGAASADNLFTLASPRILQAGAYRLRMTENSGSVLWSDYGTSGIYYPAWNTERKIIYDGSGYGYTAPFDLNFYDSTFSE